MPLTPRLSFAQAGAVIPYKCKKGECGTCKVMIDGHWTQACQTKIPALGKGEVFQVNIREVGFDEVTLGRARISSPRPLFGLLPGSMRVPWLMTNVFFTSARCPPALLHVVRMPSTANTTDLCQEQEGVGVLFGSLIP